MKIMIAALIPVLLAMCPSPGHAVPQAITYQGKLTDASGQTVPDGSYQMQFKLYDVETGGTAFWTSAIGSVTTSGGVFTTQLFPLTAADFAGKTDVWLEAWVGNPLVTLSPRVKIASVPFALRAGDINLPFAGATSASSTAFAVTSTGTGRAGQFTKTTGSQPALQVSAGGSGDAVEASSSGTGRAGYFWIQSAASSADALAACTKGTGDAFHAWTETTTGLAGVFETTNPANSLGALAATTNGSGDAFSAITYGSGNAISGSTRGTGGAAYFRIDNADNSSPAITATTNGPGRAGFFEVTNPSKFAQALYAANSGSGEAIHGESFGESAAVIGVSNGSGNAVEGKSLGTGSAGYFSVNSDTYSPALYAETRGTGYALYARSTNFVKRAGYFEGNVEIEGTLKTGPAGSSLPIAYATIGATGTVRTGTNNVSCKWSSTLQHYEITITGYDYNTYDYVTNVTPISALPRYTASYADAYGRLVVIIHDSTAARTQCDFSFVTYKP